MSFHGQVKGPIYRAILSNPVFTVPELCQWTGLTPQQIYAHLAELQKKGVIVATPLQYKHPSNSRPPHRPLNVYRVVDDIEKRRILADNVAPFLKLTGQEMPDSTSFNRATRALVDLLSSLNSLVVSYSNCEQAVSRLVEFDALIESIRRDFEVAWYEKRSLHEDIQQCLNRLAESSVRIQELRYQANAFMDSASAHKEFTAFVKKLWSQLLESPVHSVVETLNEQILEACNSGGSEPFHNSLRMLSICLKNVQEGKPLGIRMPLISALSKLLVEMLVRFGDNPSLAVEMMRRQEGFHSDDPITKYNFVNLCLLAERSDDAFPEWKAITDLALGAPSAHPYSMMRLSDPLLLILASKLRRTTYPTGFVVLVEQQNLDTHKLRQLEERLGLQGALSVVASRPIRGLAGEAYRVRSTLVDWFSPVASAIPLSAAMQTGQPDLFVYGPLEDIISFPGLASVRLASGLASLGVKDEEAWSLAMKLQQNQTLLLLQTASTVRLDDPQITELLPAVVTKGRMVSPRVEESPIARAS